MLVDYDDKNIQGRSFKYQDLTGANFYKADIRGADFSNALLRGADFSHALIGTPGIWQIGLLIVTSLLAISSGLLLAAAGSFAVIFFAPNYLQEFSFIPALLFIILITLFIIISFKRNLVTALASIVIAIAFIGVIAAAFSLLQPSSFLFNLATGVLIATLGVPITVGGSLSVAGAIALANNISGVVTALIITAVAGIVVLIWSIGIAVMGGSGIAIVIAWLLLFLGMYIGWQTVTGNKKFSLIKKFAIILTNIRSTSFRNADLTDADFTRARVKSADFRRAKLTRTCWRRVDGLSRARVDKTYLQDDKIRQLVVTGRGQSQNFGNLDLKGLNLNSANLTNASFYSTDLSESNLTSCNLSQAQLIGTNLENANLTGSNLTEAAIDQIKINRNTKLEEVICSHLYMSINNSQDNELQRVPSKGEFADDDFRQLIRSTFLTILDIYHDRNVDQKASRLALESLVKEYQIPLQVLVIEEKNDQIIIKVETPEQVNPYQYFLLSEYFSRYYQYLNSNSEQPIKLEENEHKQLIGLISKLAEQKLEDEERNIYLEHDDSFLAAENMNMKTDKSRTLNINTSGGNINASGAGAFNLGDINGNVANIINQGNPSQHKTSTYSLIEDLKSLIESESALTSENQQEIFEKIDILVEVAENIQNSAMQYQGRKAVTILKGMLINNKTSTATK